MKKNILFITTVIFCVSLILVLSRFSVQNTSAVSKTPAPTAEEGLNQKQINDLSTRIASRVAQLKLVEKRGIIGKVTDVSNTQITISDKNENTKFIDIDEFTKFISDSKSFGISDIQKGQKIGALGLYNKESRRILARFVEVLQIPDFIHGAVSSIDNKNFSLLVSQENNKQITIEVENSTKTFSFDPEKSILIKSGFTKIEEGESIIIIGFPSKTDSNLINASKIILLPDIPKNPKIKLSEKATAETPKPTITSAASPTPKTSSKKTSY